MAHSLQLPVTHVYVPIHFEGSIQTSACLNAVRMAAVAKREEKRRGNGGGGWAGLIGVDSALYIGAPDCQKSARRKKFTMTWRDVTADSAASAAATAAAATGTDANAACFWQTHDHEALAVNVKLPKKWLLDSDLTCLMMPFATKGEDRKKGGKERKLN